MLLILDIVFSILLTPILDMLIVCELQRVVLEPRVHILIHDRLRGIQVFLPLLLLFLISSLNGQDSLSELNEVFSSVSPWSA